MAQHENAHADERKRAREAALEVTGDPRHDLVLERNPDLRPLQPLDAWAAGGPVLVAGSTDARDAAVLLETSIDRARSRPARRSTRKRVIMNSE